MTVVPTRLALDHLASGQVSESPRVSWWLPAGSAVQRAREVDRSREYLEQTEGCFAIHL